MCLTQAYPHIIYPPQKVSGHKRYSPPNVSEQKKKNSLGPAPTPPPPDVFAPQEFFAPFFLKKVRLIFCEAQKKLPSLSVFLPQPVCNFCLFNKAFWSGKGLPIFFRGGGGKIHFQKGADSPVTPLSMEKE